MYSKGDIILWYDETDENVIFSVDIIHGKNALNNKEYILEELIEQNRNKDYDNLTIVDFKDKDTAITKIKGLNWQA